MLQYILIHIYSFFIGAVYSFNLTKPERKPEPLNMPSQCFPNESSLICEVCLDIFYNAANVSPCLHKFCAACIHRWADGNATCPKCRVTIKDINHDCFVQQVVEQFLEKKPERVRPAVERKKADAVELKFLEKVMTTNNRSGDSNLRRPARHTYQEYANRIQQLQAMELAAAPSQEDPKEAVPVDARQPFVAVSQSISAESGVEIDIDFDFGLAREMNLVAARPASSSPRPSFPQQWSSPTVHQRRPTVPCPFVSRTAARAVLPRLRAVLQPSPPTYSGGRQLFSQNPTLRP